MTDKTEANHNPHSGHIPIPNTKLIFTALGIPPLWRRCSAYRFAAFYPRIWQLIVPGHNSASELSGKILRGSAESPYVCRVPAAMRSEGIGAIVTYDGCVCGRRGTCFYCQ